MARLKVFGVGLLAVAVLNGCSFKVKNVKPSAPYDFNYIRTMAGFAQAAYADDAVIRALCRPAFQEVHIRVIPSTQNKYFLATSTTTKTQLISIAGTANIENALLDVDQTREFVPEVNIPLHRGFARAAKLVYEDAKPKLVAGYRVQLTGHSLGGAEALILGMILTSHGTPPESIVTFGQPKVTTDVGVEAFKGLPLTRVVNQNDIIPALPLTPFRFNGPELVLFSGTTYSLVNERPFSPKELIMAWEALVNRQPPPQMPQHYIANYMVNLESKLATSQLIAYPKALLAD